MFLVHEPRPPTLHGEKESNLGFGFRVGLIQDPCSSSDHLPDLLRQEFDQPCPPSGLSNTVRVACCCNPSPFFIDFLGRDIERTAGEGNE